MHSLKISVVTVTKNALEYLKETIDSVRSQNYSNVEHIIIDGASIDGTDEYLKKISNIQSNIRWISEMDSGIYDAMNKGLSIASGDVIGFLNAGDIYYNESVLSTIATIMVHYNIDACYADLVYVNKNNTDTITRYWRSKPYRYGLCKRGWMPPHPTFYAHKRIYEHYGRFDTAYKIQSDFEMIYRLLEVYKIKTKYVPEIWIKMRTGGISNSIMGIIQGNIEAIMACRKHGYNAGLIFILKKITQRLPQFFLRP